MSESLPVAVLIEDDPQIRRFVRTSLEAEGWHVFEATTMRHEEERCDIRASEAAMDEIVVTAACARQGQTPRDRTFTLNLTDIDAMSIDTGGDKVGVQRCAG